MNSHLKTPHGEEFEDLAPAETTRPEQKMALIAATGSHFQLECRTFADGDWHGADWILLPYVHPVDDPARKRFVKDLRGALDARRSGKANLKAALLSRLSAMEPVTELVAIYQRHFRGGRDAISMSLYSGPFAQRAR